MMIFVKSLKGLPLSFIDPPGGTLSVHCKGGSSPPPPAPPPAYEPPPPPEPPPVYVPPPSPYDEANKEELEKAKKKISSQARGRSSTILTGLLTEAPATQKTKLKRKLGE